MISGDYRVDDDALHAELCDTSLWLEVREETVSVALLISEEFSREHEDGTCEVSDYAMPLDDIVIEFLESCGPRELPELVSVADVLGRLAQHARMAIEQVQRLSLEQPTEHPES